MRVVPLILAVFILTACSDDFDRADATNVDAVAKGKAVYGENCASCHGANLEGQPNWKVVGPDGVLPAPPHNDDGHTWHHGDDLLFRYVKLGGAKIAPAGFKSGMPGYEDILSDSDIWAVLSFIKNKWSAKAQARQRQMAK